jgi:hypothetical protein
MSFDVPENQAPSMQVYQGGMIDDGYFKNINIDFKNNVRSRD